MHLIFYNPILHSLLLLFIYHKFISRILDDYVSKHRTSNLTMPDFHIFFLLRKMIFHHKFNPILVLLGLHKNYNKIKNYIFKLGTLIICSLCAPTLGLPTYSHILNLFLIHPLIEKHCNISQ